MHKIKEKIRNNKNENKEKGKELYPHAHTGRKEKKCTHMHIQAENT